MKKVKCWARFDEPLANKLIKFEKYYSPIFETATTTNHQVLISPLKKYYFAEFCILF